MESAAAGHIPPPHDKRLPILYNKKESKEAEDESCRI